MTRAHLMPAAAAAFAALLLAGCQTAASRVAAAETSPQSCGRAFAEQGYRDGLAGKPSRANAGGCPAADRQAYETRYGAGVYVAKVQRGKTLGDDARTAQAIPGAKPVVGVDAPTYGGVLPGGCDPASSRQAGRVGAVQRAPCPDFTASRNAYLKGQRDMQRTLQMQRLKQQAIRIEQQLMKPSLAPSQRVLLERQLRTIENQQRMLPFKPQL